MLLAAGESPTSEGRMAEDSEQDGGEEAGVAMDEEAEQMEAEEGNNGRGEESDDSSRSMESGRVQRKVCLRDPTSLCQRLQEESFLPTCRDVSLRCRDGRLRAHRLVLAAASPFLRGLFMQQGGNGDGKEEEVVVLLPQASCTTVQQLLTFAYTGQLHIQLGEAKDFLHLATLVGMDPADVRMDKSEEEDCSIEASGWDDDGDITEDSAGPVPPKSGVEECGTQTALSDDQGSCEEEPRPAVTRLRRSTRGLGIRGGNRNGRKMIRKKVVMKVQERRTTRNSSRMKLEEMEEEVSLDSCCDDDDEDSEMKDEAAKELPPSSEESGSGETTKALKSKRRIEVPPSCRTQSGGLQCDFCSRVFQTARAWQDHRESHTSTQTYQCSVCAKVYKTHRAWYQHTQYHKYRAEKAATVSTVTPTQSEDPPPATLPHQCSFCPKSFKAQRSLEEHQLTHTSTQTLPCEICGKSYPSHRKLYFHLKSHVKSANYKHVADRISGLLRALVGRARSEGRGSESSKKEGEKQELSCPHCGRTYKDARSFNDHMVKHTGREKVGCGVCGKQLGSYRALYQHLQHHRRSRPGEQSVINCLAALRRMGKVGARRGRPRKVGSEEATTLAPAPESVVEVQLTELPTTTVAPPPPHKCVVCSRRLPSSEALSWHLTKHRPWVMLPCPQCGKPCSSEAVLKQHCLVVHSEERPYPCPHCPLRFKTESRLRGHSQHHNPIKGLACTHCPKRFNCARNLRQHINRQHGEHSTEEPPRWGCEACGKRFRMRECLQQHLKTHSGERPFQCERCGKRFVERGQLRQHLRTHTGEKPFQCEFCGRAFAQQSQLSAHRRTHTGERPFKCSLCGKAFGQMVILQDHHMRHTGQKRFQCSYCPKAFVSRTDFRGHVNLHTGEKPYQCRFCPMRFPAVSNRAHHERRHKDNRDPRIFM